MLLKDLSFTAKRQSSPADARIEDCSRVVCALVIKAFRKRVKTSDFWKISIRFNHGDRADEGRVLSGVLIGYVDIDVDAIASLDVDEQAKKVLDILIRYLTGIFRVYGLPLALLDEARNFVVQNEFKNVISAKPRLPSPDKQKFAHVVAEQTSESASIELRVETRNGKLIRGIPIAVDSPNEFVFQRYFGKVSWLDNNKLVLTRVDGVEILVNLQAN